MPVPRSPAESTYGCAGVKEARRGQPRGVNIAAVAAATPHINIPGKSARVKHLFSTRGFSKWRESGCSNSAEATITRLAGRLSICILSTEEFITASAFSLDSFSFSRFPSYLYIDLPFVVIVIGEIFVSPAGIGSRATCRFYPAPMCHYVFDRM